MKFLLVVLFVIVSSNSRWLPARIHYRSALTKIPALHRTIHYTRKPNPNNRLRPSMRQRVVRRKPRQ